jgi:hypothetical protein
MATTASFLHINSTIVRSLKLLVAMHHAKYAAQRLVSTLAAHPAIHRVVYGISALFLVRGLFLLPQFLGYNIFSAAQTVSTHDLVFSALVLAIGVIFAAGLNSLETIRRPRTDVVNGVQ